MTTLHERYPDLLDEHADPQTLRVIQDLDTVCTSTTAPPSLRAALAETLQARAMVHRRERAARIRPPATRRGRLVAAVRGALPRSTPATGPTRTPIRQARARLISLVAAVALVLSGVAGYLHLQEATPVSAQAILQRAARAFPAAAPDQVIHQTSQVYFGERTTFGLDPHTVVASGPITLTVDQWTQLDATGAISRQVTTGTSSAGALLFRILQTGRQATIYDARTNVLEQTTAPAGGSLSWLERPLGAVDLQQVVRAAAQGLLPHLRLLPRQTLNGVLVDVVEVRFPAPTGGKLIVRGGASALTVYVDAQTYAIRGFDRTEQWAQGNWTLSESLRVTASTTLPLAAVPAGTFTLQAPADARVVAPPYQPLSVAQAVALVDGPTPLLPGAPDGLRLRAVTLTHDPEFTGVGYSYEAGAPALGQFDPAYRAFGVAIQTSPAASQAAEPMSTVEQPLTLTIAGQTVEATYYELAVSAPLTQSALVVYHQGTTTVTLSGTGLSKDEFLALVGALVDGRTHPTVVAQLQRDLDASAAFTTNGS